MKVFHVFSRLTINIAPYGSIRLAQPKVAGKGWTEVDHSGLGGVCYDVRHEKGKF